MAFFLKNNCTFKNCEAVFPSLFELIQHIESNHIDFDENTVKSLELENRSDIHPSYILKFTDIYTLVKDNSGNDNNCDLKICHGKKKISEKSKRELARRNSQSCSNDTNTSNISELTDRSTENGLRPFVCQVPGCEKRYKYVNGYNYHLRNAHKDKNIFQKYGIQRKVQKKNSVERSAATILNEVIQKI